MLAFDFLKSFTGSMDLLIRKIHYIMSHIPSVEASVEKTDYDMWSGSGECSLPSQISASTVKLILYFGGRYHY